MAACSEVAYPAKSWVRIPLGPPTIFRPNCRRQHVDMIDIEDLEKFVTPFYANTDIMHGLPHIVRILKAAKTLTKNYEGKIDSDLIVLGSYFHGMIAQNDSEITRYLTSKDLPKEMVNRVLKVTWESLKEEVPETLEGKIVHDAHLIEGGKTFIIVKSLITGSIIGQTLEETIEHIENNVLGKFKCYLPESQRIYAKKEAFAATFLKQLKKDLAP
jgi:uncharacterized protein